MHLTDTRYIVAMSNAGTYRVKRPGILGEVVAVFTRLREAKIERRWLNREERDNGSR